MRHKSHTVKVIYKECKTRQAKQKNNLQNSSKLSYTITLFITKLHNVHYSYGCMGIQPMNSNKSNHIKSRLKDKIMSKTKSGFKNIF